jgi:hypothetical protein
MSIKINDFMAVETGGSVIATATRVGDGRWNVGGWPGRCRRGCGPTAPGR